MDPRSRAAVIQRWQAIAGNEPCPTSWDQLTVTQQLTVENLDPQLANVFRGSVDSQTELELISGKFASSYEGPSIEEQVAAARERYMADAEAKMIADLEALAASNAEASRRSEQSRLESIAIADAALAAQARVARGW
jgi:hypothetical protein